MVVDSLEITTVIGCRNMCKFCPQKLLVGQYKKSERNFKMSLEDFKLAIDKVPTEVRIDFSGMAEPWLNDKCTDMVLYAHEKGHRIAIYTTCVGMTTEDIERIKHINFETVVVHLRDSKGYTNIPDTTEHDSTVERFIKEMKNATTMSMDKNYMHSRAGNVNFLPRKAYIGSIKCLDSITPRRGVLLPDGTVLLCCMDYGMEHVLGNLFTDTYESIYNSEEYNNVLLNMRTSKELILCRTCNYARRYE
jgi:sulfatase maturation enzyme AslB (radical SAM superfamily)